MVTRTSTLTHLTTFPTHKGERGRRIRRGFNIWSNNPRIGISDSKYTHFFYKKQIISLESHDFYEIALLSLKKFYPIVKLPFNKFVESCKTTIFEINFYKIKPVKEKFHYMSEYFEKFRVCKKVVLRERENRASVSFFGNS